MAGCTDVQCPQRLMGGSRVVRSAVGSRRRRVSVDEVELTPQRRQWRCWLRAGVRSRTRRQMPMPMLLQLQAVITDRNVVTSLARLLHWRHQQCTRLAALGSALSRHVAVDHKLGGRCSCQLAMMPRLSDGVSPDPGRPSVSSLCPSVPHAGWVEWRDGRQSELARLSSRSSCVVSGVVAFSSFRRVTARVRTSRRLQAVTNAKRRQHRARMGVETSHDDTLITCTFQGSIRLNAGRVDSAPS